MTISVNYSTPVEVNGYACKNCTDVDYAKKHIDPAHPKDGPFGINAKDRPNRLEGPTPDKAPAVKLGGGLSGLALSPGGPTVPATGTQLNISA